MDNFPLVIIFCVLIVPLSGYNNFHRRESGHEHNGYRQSSRSQRHISGRKGEEDSSPVPEPCPVQCRCIALSHLGYRGMAERWMSLGRVNGQENTFKGTESPVWQEDPAELKGRDVVCMGLNKIPRPLPHDVIKLTLYGDSSNVVEEQQAQISYMRESSFVSGQNIEQLAMSGNNLQILYPFIFRKLISLKHLALQNNNISHISAAAFSGLSDLIELRLSDNKLRYLSPNIFSQMTSLEYLFLNGNKMMVLNSMVLRRMFKLKHLDLSRNNFRSFSDSVFDSLVNLQELLINENNIWHIRSRWFQSLRNLRKLEMRSNVITQIETSTFKYITNLEQLFLSANKINTVSNDAFMNLNKLRELDLGRNDINNLEPDCFVGLNMLVSLDLSVNRLYFINNRTFTATLKLQTLDLSQNTISEIEEAALHPLSTLQKLDLSHNKLKTIRSKTFSGLLELNNVNLEHNIISDVENDAFIVAPLNQLSKIIWLSLQHNNLKEINAYALYGLPHLKVLNLGHNKIRAVHKKSFYTLSSLQNLLLHDNKIKSFEDGTFVNLKQLISLTLENNKVALVSDDTFLGLKNLDDLNVAANGLEVISKNAFRHLSKLSTLNLQKNLISTFNFNDLVHVKKVTFIDLSNNQLFDVAFPNHKSHDIRQLKFTDNQLQTLSSDVTNVLAPSGNLWLKGNPWTCDCRLKWLPEYIADYKLRVFGSRDTICNSPGSLLGQMVTSVPVEDYRCDNSSIAESIMCENLQIRYTTAGQTDAIRKTKKEARRWHVTFDSADTFRNSSLECFGILISNDWVLTRRLCTEPYLQNNNTKITVDVGRKDVRTIALFVDYVTDSQSPDSDLRLVRLVSEKKPKSSESGLPCILTHPQFHKLAHASAEGVFTTKFFKNDTKKMRFMAKRGKIIQKCEHNGDICLKTSKTRDTASLQGSPLSLRYQGVWYFAGIGHSSSTVQSQVQRFTPLWAINQWLALTMHEVDTKCIFKRNQSLCEDLKISGLVKSTKFNVVVA